MFTWPKYRPRWPSSAQTKGPERSTSLGLTGTLERKQVTSPPEGTSGEYVLKPLILQKGKLGPRGRK